MRSPLSQSEAVYQRLPVALQHAVCSAVGWRTERTRYAGDFQRLLAEAESRSFWSASEIAEFRDRRLRDVISHCTRTVPYYAEAWRRRGVDPSSIRSLDDLQQLPVLTKGEVQDAIARLQSTVAQPKTSIVHTSGTTGGALRFPLPLRSVQEIWAIWWRFRGWHGIRRGTWSALFAGRSVVPVGQLRPPFWRINAPGKQILFSGYHMSEGNLAPYVDELRRRQPPWLHGYPSLLTLLASYVVDRGIDFGYEIRWVSIGAESLMPHQSALIQRAFGVAPIQHYGMAEGVANLSECDRRHLHVDEDFSAVEFLPAAVEGQYRIVGTGFSNPAFPLVRYDTNDLATLREGTSCPCGRPGRVVESVDGRREDYIVLRSGARVGRMDHVFKDMVNVREAQIRQRRPGEITILIVQRPEYGKADETALIHEAKKRVGDDTDIAVEYVGELARSPVGKLRFVVSEVDDGQSGRIWPPA